MGIVRKGKEGVAILLRFGLMDFWLGSGMLCFAMVFAGFAPKGFQNIKFHMCFTMVFAHFHFSAVADCFNCYLVPLLRSSPPFTASSKMRKTLGPFVKKVLRPPAGTLRGPTCSFYCVLHHKIGIGLNTHRFFNWFLRGSKRPPGDPQEA